MSRALSVDLRIRVLAAVNGGASHRKAAERFGVSAASVSRWRHLQIQQGNVLPGPLDGERKSHKTEAHADLIMTCLGEHRDGTLFELRKALADQGISISKSALHRFLNACRTDPSDFSLGSVRQALYRFSGADTSEHRHVVS